MRSSLISFFVFSLREFEFNKMGFSEFMSTCTGEVEAAINTQMFNVFGQQRGLGKHLELSTELKSRIFYSDFDIFRT